MFKLDLVKAIAAFNNMYKLPVAYSPTLDVGVPTDERLIAFKNILIEECNEIDEIIEVIKNNGADGKNGTDALTMIADLLGDIQVYCASEMAKFGLPWDEVMAIIMASNMSKLGPDGLPIYDERGKVLKGPGYWKPEPQIREMLMYYINEANAKPENVQFVEEDLSATRLVNSDLNTDLLPGDAL